METTGLKEEDSSVEIYMENILKGEARHKCTCKYTHTHAHKQERRQIRGHAHKTNRTAQVRAQTTERQKTRVNVNITMKHIETVCEDLPQQLSKTSICAFTYCYMLHALLGLQPQPKPDSPPSPVLAPPDASHLLGAHQEANRLASAGVGRGVAVGVGAGGAGRAVGGQAGQMILSAIVLGQLAEVLLPPLDAELKREQRLELQSLYGAQQDHGV